MVGTTHAQKTTFSFFFEKETPSVITIQLLSFSYISQFGFDDISFIWPNLQKKQKWPFRSSRQCIAIPRLFYIRLFNNSQSVENTVRNKDTNSKKTAFSYFPTMFSKAFSARVGKTRIVCQRVKISWCRQTRQSL